MSQTIKCPSCGELIDVDEQIRKDAEEKILSAPAIKEVLMNSFETNPNDIVVS